MKKSSPLSLFAALTLTLVGAHAQVVTQVGAETTGGTLPGSPSEYIIFNGTDYNQIGSDGAGTYKNLPDFEIVGGEFDNAGDAGFSTINTPGNVASLRTGGITSTNQIAVGLELLGSISPTGLASDGFNFNDFNIYVMVDSAPGDTFFDDTVVRLDARLDNAEAPQVNFTLTSQNTSLSGADYVEYNVTGLGTAIAASELAHPGTNNDLVLRVDKANGQGAVLGGIGFESVDLPEPSTWAMMFLSAGGLVFLARRTKSRVYNAA